MTVVFMEGWDGFGSNSGITGLTTYYTSVGGSFTLVAGKDGVGQALRQPPANTGGLTAMLDTAVSEFTFASFVNPALSATRVVSLYSNTTEMIGWRYNSSDGSIGVYRGSTLLGSSAAGVIAADGVFRLLEIECVIDDLVGRITVYWDNVQVINLTGVDTRNGTPTTVDRIRWNPTAASIGASQYDHTFVTDSATKPTEQYWIETVPVAADGATLDFTPSTGTDHFAVVDDLPVGTTDYLQGSTVGNIDELIVGTLSSTPTAILAVQGDIYTARTDVTAREMKLGVKSGATMSAGTSTPIAQTGTRISRRMNTNPNTAAAWTASAFTGSALRLRPEVSV